MSHDALFQLGMGSVPLNASQKEETFDTRALKARAEAIPFGSQSRPFALPGIALPPLAVADLFRAAKKRRGNSAKALILRPGSAAVPSTS